MGKVKLTLSVEENLIFKAKQIAQIKKQSLSNIIENYLADILINNQEILSPSKAKTLRGIGKSDLSTKTDKEIVAKMYEDRFEI